MSQKEQLIKELDNLLQSAETEISGADDQKNLEELNIKYLGKKGRLKQLMKEMVSLSGEEKKEAGMKSNEVKNRIIKAVEASTVEIEKRLREEKLRQGVMDISIPGNIPPMGYHHPISQVLDRMITIFKKMGYSVESGPELEEEFYNFDALNIPSNHPARDDHDSFYINQDKLMRTHTSPVQVRYMKENQPPIAIVAPGRCYRRDAVDATHNHTFYQMEGLVVDKNISFSDLKGTLLLWTQMMFGEHTKIRLRPDFFPFTEPSAELAVTCPKCAGKGCNVCKQTGWIEIGGCGLVDPEVFKNVGLDPEEYSGFAFGLGVERIAMVVYGINDIRMFFQNDMRLLRQFVKEMSWKVPSGAAK